MGVGKPEDLVEGVRRGVDMFDCVMPTRNARNSHLFIDTGVLKLRNAASRTYEGPIDEDSRLPYLPELQSSLSPSSRQMR